MALTDADKDIVEAYDTDAYGNTLIFDEPDPVDGWFGDDASTTNNPTCQFIFTGRRYDPETSDPEQHGEIYFYRGRHYHSSLGRFLSRDPIGYTGGMGLYSYVSSRPTALADPFGLYGAETHRWMTRQAIRGSGLSKSVRRRIEDAVVEANVASDEWGEFLKDTAGHALSKWGGLSEEHVRGKWAARIGELKGEIADMLESGNFREEDLFRAMGRLLHFIQDARFHCFKRWLGGHFNPWIALGVGAVAGYLGYRLFGKRGAVGGFVLGTAATAVLQAKTGWFDPMIAQEMRLDEIVSKSVAERKPFSVLDDPLAENMGLPAAYQDTREALAGIIGHPGWNKAFSPPPQPVYYPPLRGFGLLKVAPPYLRIPR